MPGANQLNSSSVCNFCFIFSNFSKFLMLPLPFLSVSVRIFSSSSDGLINEYSS
ncbi:unnamed protein product [Schistosoma mattheei]|uniref:Uncharacterized protein n=1 Tax=Schistosoma mattheei TaxID=31246 RepID=A0A3P8GS46_9TREM|nr:unnamed protein product [Schistosoma mattheei]